MDAAMPTKKSNDFVIFGGPSGHPQYEENSNRLHKGQNVGMEQCCVYCGKHCLSAKFWVYLTGISEIIEKRSGDDPANQDDLGFYPIGSECKNLALKAGKPVYDAKFNRVVK